MSADPRIVFLFVDGCGLGVDDPSVNPLAAAATPVLDRLCGGRPLAATAPSDAGQRCFRHLDATLGRPGLPQSATGQTSLLTGTNAAERMNGHYGPWPGPTLRRVLARDTLFHVAPHGAVLANVYPPAYFDALARGRTRENAPVRAARSAGVELLDLDAYRTGRGVPADLTGAWFASVDAALPVLAPAEAGARLVRLADRASFVFFDLWLTDRIGHRGAMDEAVELAERIDAFVGGALEARDGATIVLTSDHGNFEEMHTRTHTRNAVPLIAAGPHAPAFARCASITDVFASVLAAWRGAGCGPG